MTALRGFAGGFCVVCVAAGIFMQLCPAGHTKRAVQTVLGWAAAVCLCAAIAGFVGTEWQLPEVDTELSTQSALEDACVWNFRLALDSAGISYSKIRVLTDKTASGSITITKVQVVTDADYQTVYRLLGGQEATYVIETVDANGLAKAESR